MPITRTPIIDDDGSGETGTLFEDAWKVELYDQIDEAVDGATAAGDSDQVVLGVEVFS